MLSGNCHTVWLPILAVRQVAEGRAVWQLSHDCPQSYVLAVLHVSEGRAVWQLTASGLPTGWFFLCSSGCWRMRSLATATLSWLLTVLCTCYSLGCWRTSYLATVSRLPTVWFFLCTSGCWRMPCLATATLSWSPTVLYMYLLFFRFLKDELSGNCLIIAHKSDVVYVLQVDEGRAVWQLSHDCPQSDVVSLL